MSISNFHWIDSNKSNPTPKDRQPFPKDEILMVLFWWCLTHWKCAPYWPQMSMSMVYFPLRKRHPHKMVRDSLLSAFIPPPPPCDDMQWSRLSVRMCLDGFCSWVSAHDGFRTSEVLICIGGLLICSVVVGFACLSAFPASQCQDSFNVWFVLVGPSRRFQNCVIIDVWFVCCLSYFCNETHALEYI